MTAQDIIEKLFTGKGFAPERVKKAQGLAIRSKVDWSEVLAAMTEAQRKMVTDAG